MDKPFKVLVIGTADKQTLAAAGRLRSGGFPVRALLPPSRKAGGMAAMGVEVVEGDVADAALVVDAARGVGGVFLVGTPLEKGVPATPEPGKAVVRICRSLGIDRLVYSSTCRVEGKTGNPHVDSRLEVEAFIRETGQPCTILRPTFFMENFESRRLLPSLLGGVLTLPLLPEKKMQMLAMSDIGEFVTQAFLRPEDFMGREIDLAGDELTMEETASLISEVIGRPVRYLRIPDESAGFEVGHGMAMMYRWFNRRERRVDIEALRRAFGVRLTTFVEYLASSPAFVRRKAA
jgi:uncharacterized protein YbjT (DUF2867 family)